MSLQGHVYRITDPAVAFVPVVLGEGQPVDGFAPWRNATVTAVFWFPQPWDASFLVPVPAPSVTTASDGSFVIGIPAVPGLTLRDVSLTVTSGVTVYRSTRVPIKEARGKRLDFWIFHEKLPASDGVTAGDVSSTVGGAGLPANTTISASPAGLEFTALKDMASIQFGIRMVPDLSLDLNAMLDVELHSWSINVLPPESFVVPAAAVLSSIKAGLNSAAGSVNAAVLKKMEAVLVSEEHLLAATVEKFLTKQVSVTFVNVAYPSKHTWRIADVHDRAVVITADPCIGFPRYIGSELPA